MDALAQVVERGQVLAPVGVEVLQQHHAHERRELLLAHHVELDLERRLGGRDHHLDDLLVVDGLALLHHLRQRHVEQVLGEQRLLQAGQVPLLLDALRGHERAREVVHRSFAQVGDLVDQRLRLEDLVALLVDHLALVVGDVVVLQQLLAHVEVARLDLALRAFQAAADDAGLDGLALGHLQALHDRLDAVAREDAHQRVFQRQVEARGARVALAARTAAQLVVDAARLVALGGDDAQAAGGLDLGVERLPLVLQLLDLPGLLVFRHGGVGLEVLDLLLDVAAQHDVGAAAGHVGGDGDRTGAARLRHDQRLALVLLGVEHLVRDLGLLQQARQQLGVLDGRGAHQRRLAAVDAVADVFHHGQVLLARGLVDEVQLVLALRGAVRRDHHGLEAVDLLELVGLGVGRAGHAGQLGVHAEVVLERDRGECLVLALDLDAFLGLDGLVQTVRPAAARHQATGELVDDRDLAVLHDVVLVAVVQVVRAQRRVHVVHQRDVGRVVQAGVLDQQAGRGQQFLGALVAGLGERDLVGLLVDREVARLDDALAGARVGLADLALQGRHDGVDAHVHLGVVFGLAADDQRRAGLVDQDRIDLVDDGEVQAPLHAIGGLVDHVVAQVVEAELVVGAVGDVGGVGGLLLLARQAGHVHAHRHAEVVVEAAHPLGVAARQVVVDRHQVHTLAGQRIEVDRQRGHQRLAFAGAHLGDLAVVQRHAADQLHVEVAHLQRALAGLADHGEDLGQQVVERAALLEAGAELGRLALQRLVAERRRGRLERGDLLDDAAILLEQSIVSATENLGEELGQHAFVLGREDRPRTTHGDRFWRSRL